MTLQPNTTMPIGPRVKIYKATLTQTGTAAPEATIIQNTIGNIIWTRDSLGIYDGTLNEAFTENKTLIPPFGPQDGPWMQIFSSAPNDYSYNIKRYSEDTIRITFIKNSDGTNAEWSTAFATIYLEIQIYS